MTAIFRPYGKRVMHSRGEEEEEEASLLLLLFLFSNFSLSFMGRQFRTKLSISSEIISLFSFLPFRKRGGGEGVEEVGERIHPFHFVYFDKSKYDFIGFPFQTV